MYSLSIRNLELLAGVVCLLVGVFHFVVLFFMRRRPACCSKAVRGSCVRINHESGVSFFTADSTSSRYSCVFGFEYEGKYYLVKQRDNYSKAQYEIGEEVLLYVNPDDLSDFWYRNKRGFLYYTIIGIFYICLSFLFFKDFVYIRKILTILFETES